MSDSSGEGFVALNQDLYFTCSSGLAPAKMYPTQNNHATGDKFYYLVKDDTAVNGALGGDFFCRWTVVLAAAIAAAGIVTGGAALLVLGAAAIAAGGLLCGGLMAPMRKWVGYSTLNAYGRKDAFSLTSKCQMVCPIGGVVTYAPGITGFWSALVYTARNTVWAIAEGAIVGKLGSSGFGAFAGTATPAFSTALLNFVTLNVAARGMGVADQVLFEGMLRNGKSLSDTGEEAIAGATMFEQPFINIYNRSESGYYTGGYAKDAEGNDIPEAHNGHGAGALITDTYYAGLSAISLGLMAKASATHENIAKEAIVAAKEKIAELQKGGKKFLFERGVSKALLEASKEAVTEAQSQSPKPKVAGAMEFKDGIKKGSSSNERTTNAFVDKLIEDLPPNERGPGHGNCAEMKILTEKTNEIAQNKGVSVDKLSVEEVKQELKGSDSYMREVRTKDNPKANTPKSGCKTCTHAMKKLGINDRVPPKVSPPKKIPPPLPIDNNNDD